MNAISNFICNNHLHNNIESMFFGFKSLELNVYCNLVLNFDPAACHIKAIEMAVIFRITEVQNRRLIQSLPFFSSAILHTSMFLSLFLSYFYVLLV